MQLYPQQIENRLPYAAALAIRCCTIIKKCRHNTSLAITSGPIIYWQPVNPSGAPAIIDPQSADLRCRASTLLIYASCTQLQMEFHSTQLHTW